MIKKVKYSLEKWDIYKGIVFFCFMISVHFFSSVYQTIRFPDYKIETIRIVRGGISNREIQKLFENGEYDYPIDYTKLTDYIESLKYTELKELFSQIDKFASDVGFENLGVQARYIYFKLLAKGERKVIKTSISLPQDVKQKLYDLIDVDKYYTFATLSQVIFEWLMDEGKFDQLKKGHLLNGPKIIFASPINPAQYFGEPAKRTRITRRYNIFTQPAPVAGTISYLDLYGIESVMLNLGNSTDPERLLKENIDERTYFISLATRNPPNRANLETILMADRVIQESIESGYIHQAKRPLLIAGGASTFFNRDSLFNLTPLQIIFRTYAEMNLVDMMFSPDFLQARESETAPDVSMFNDIANLYVKDKDGNVYLTKYISDATSPFERRLRLVFRAFDFTKLPYEDYWSLLPQGLYPENKYMAKKVIDSMWTLQGPCERKCEFCVDTFRSQGTFYLSPQELIDFIKRAVQAHPEVERIAIPDRNFLVNRERAIEFAQLFRKNFKDTSLTLHIQGEILSTDSELLGILKDAGVEIIDFGIEVFSKRVLSEIGRFEESLDYHKFLEIPQKALDLGFPILRIDSVLFYPSITQKELVETIKIMTGFLNQGAHPYVYHYVIPRPGAPIMEEDKYEIKYREIRLTNGKTYQMPSIVLPDDPVVRQIAAESVAQVEAELEAILKEYNWQGDFPEQVEALALYRITIKNLKKTFDRDPELTDEMLDGTIEFINEVIRKFMS